METKTDMEPDIHLTVEPTMTVSEVQKEVEKRMGWLPTSQLKRCVGRSPPLVTTAIVQVLLSDLRGSRLIENHQPAKRCVG